MAPLMLHLHFITAVWGRAYTDLFLQVVVPNQLSAGNLLYFRDKPGSVTYKIYTTQADAEHMRASPCYAQLAAAVPVEIVLFEDVDLGAKYGALIECHRRAISTADEVGAALVFLSPDAIWSDGTFRRLWQLGQAGTRVVMVGSIRLVKETFVPAYLAAHYCAATCSAAIAARDLVGLAMEHLHPLTEALFCDSERFGRGPSHIYWRVGKDGILARCFHLHPLMVNPLVRGLLPKSTVDADYTPLACPDPASLCVVEDSDEIAGFELSAREQFGSFAPNRFSAADTAFYARYWTQSHHRKFVRHPIRFHAAELSPQWQDVEQLSDRVLDTVELYLRYPAIFLGGKILRRAARKTAKYMLLPFLGRAGVERLKKRVG
jgi:hypothetical protein